MQSPAVFTEADVIAPPVLRLDRLRFELEVLDPIRLPRYSGSAWRGLLGRGLRQSACVTRQPSCDGCLLRAQCAYSRFFETPPVSPEIERRYRALPHPFVLEPEGASADSVDPGGLLRLGLTVIGPAGELLPYLIHAMQRAGETGLGRQDGRFKLRRVQQNTRLGGDDWVEIYDADLGRLAPVESVLDQAGPCPEPLGVRLLTPLRLKRRGRLIDAERIDARDFLSALTTRVSMLGELYSSGAAPLERDAVHAAIDGVALESRDLRWVDWTRWSSRQRVHMQLGGLIGTLVLRGPGLPALWPLIQLGQWLHLGKATSFGLGGYRVLPQGDTGG